MVCMMQSKLCAGMCVRRPLPLSSSQLAARPSQRLLGASGTKGRLVDLSYHVVTSTTLNSPQLGLTNTRRGGAFIVRANLGGDTDASAFTGSGSYADDYYSVLGLTPDATPTEIKRGYYACMKACHPDLSGDHPEVTAFCMFVNEVYEVLSDPVQRQVYDEINGYALAVLNPFDRKDFERDQAFVDEFTCIGCKNCANTAEATFMIEEDFGRARVFDQSGNSVKKIQEAIDTCPVSCIHWVTAPQLTLLEDEMRIMERVSVGIMASGQGYQGPGVFEQARWRWEKRQARAVAKARVEKSRQKNKSGGTGTGMPAWWESNVFGGSATAEQEPQAAASAKDVRAMSERAKRAAAAARRWREYSRQRGSKVTYEIGDGSILDSSIIEERQEEETEASRDVEGVGRR